VNKRTRSKEENHKLLNFSLLNQCFSYLDGKFDNEGSDCAHGRKRNGRGYKTPLSSTAHFRTISL